MEPIVFESPEMLSSSAVCCTNSAVLLGAYSCSGVKGELLIGSPSDITGQDTD